MTAPSYFCGRISAAARRLLGRRNCSTNFIPPEESPLLSSRRAPTQNSLKGLERRLIRHMNGIKKETNQKIENLDRKIENVEGSLNAKIANVGLNLNTKMSQLELNLNTNMSNLNTKMSRLPFVVGSTIVGSIVIGAALAEKFGFIVTVPWIRAKPNHA